jgi:hypothetical protein
VKHILHKALKAIAVGAAVIFPLVANLNTPIVSALSGSILFLGQPNITLATTVQIILPPKTVIVVGTSTQTSTPTIGPLAGETDSDQAILNEALNLVQHSLKTGKTPYWAQTSFLPGQKVAASEVPDVLAHLMSCENPNRVLNSGLVPKIVDSNGFYSYGLLMFQKATWEKWSVKSGITGDPTNAHDAITMGTWAIENGNLTAWSCASILRIVKK